MKLAFFEAFFNKNWRAFHVIFMGDSWNFFWREHLSGIWNFLSVIFYNFSISGFWWAEKEWNFFLTIFSSSHMFSITNINVCQNFRRVHSIAGDSIRDKGLHNMPRYEMRWAYDSNCLKRYLRKINQRSKFDIRFFGRDQKILERYPCKKIFRINPIGFLHS